MHAPQSPCDLNHFQSSELAQSVLKLMFSDRRTLKSPNENHSVRAAVNVVGKGRGTLPIAPRKQSAADRKETQQHLSV